MSQTNSAEVYSPVSESDFDAFALDDSNEFPVLDPNQKPMVFRGREVTMTILSPAAEDYAKAKDELDKESLKVALQQQGRLKPGEQVDEHADARFLSKVVKLNNFPYPGGEFELFKTRKFSYIANQGRAKLGDLGNFFSNGKKG